MSSPVETNGTGGRRREVGNEEERRRGSTRPVQGRHSGGPSNSGPGEENGVGGDRPAPLTHKSMSMAASATNGRWGAAATGIDLHRAHLPRQRPREPIRERGLAVESTELAASYPALPDAIIPAVCAAVEPTFVPAIHASQLPTCSHLASQPSSQLRASPPPFHCPRRLRSCRANRRPNRPRSPAGSLCQPSSQRSLQPPNRPFVMPSSQASMQPSSQPSSQPSTQLSSQPSSQPSSQWSSQPPNRPSLMPSSEASTQPSSQPSSQLSTELSSQPSSQLSSQRSSQPPNPPSVMPSSEASTQPSSQPANPRPSRLRSSAASHLSSRRVNGARSFRASFLRCHPVVYAAVEPTPAATLFLIFPRSAECLCERET
ncbi:hypothetical protein ACHAWF_003930 [Thalassiosira exigua]